MPIESKQLHMVWHDVMMLQNSFGHKKGKKVKRHASRCESLYWKFTFSKNSNDGQFNFKTIREQCTNWEKIRILLFI